MTLAEVIRALRELRVSGMAATLEPASCRPRPTTGRRSDLETIATKRGI